MGAKTGQKGNQSVHFLSTWSSSFIHMMVLQEHKAHPPSLLCVSTN